MPTLLARPLILVVAVLASLAPLLGAGPAHAGEDPDVGRPEVGSCHDLSFKQAQAETDPAPATPCDEPRTLITVGVLDAGTDPDWGSEQLLQRSATDCFSDVLAYFGARNARRLALTSYEPYIFYPTEEERQAGATWVRCDVGLIADSVVVDLPRRPTDLRPLNRRFAYCLAPRRKDYRQTVCSREHAFSAKAAIEGPRGRYPGERAWNRVARGCPESAPYFYPPTKASFDGGLRYLVCFATR